MAGWRAGRALLKLRTQIDTFAPDRYKGDDGTIGDASHQSRASDHNPWVGPDPDGYDIVTAIDISHDPRHGVDTYKLADMIRISRDARVKYVISNRRIASSTVYAWQWRPYNGANPHDHHMHVSVLPQKRFYDDNVTEWKVKSTGHDPNAPQGPAKPTLRLGSTGPDVSYVQTALGITVDGDYGPVTANAVMEFQKARGLAVDGVCGPQTWDAILAGGKVA